jgi:hypothetical protein
MGDNCSVSSVLIWFDIGRCLAYLLFCTLICVLFLSSLTVAENGGSLLDLNPIAIKYWYCGILSFEHVENDDFGVWI